MPKTNKVVKIDNRRIKVKASAVKFRIGNRKGGVSGMLMSNSALEAVIADSSRSKWHTNAQAVLALRAA